MNAILIMVVVNIIVLTLMVAITVIVVMDICYNLMDTIVKVCAHTF